MGQIGFIGAGNMAEAIIGGMLKKGLYAPGEVAIYDVRRERMQELSSSMGIVRSEGIEDLVRDSRTIIVAVKPGTVSSVLGQVKDILGGKLLISIAAGITIQKIQAVVGMGMHVVRVMPNTPALVLEGAAGLCASESCTEDDLKVAQAIFSSVGLCVVVDEGMMNAVTALSGSGPAFCFLFIEALADGAVRAGLPRDLAVKLAAATLKGAASMVLETGRHPGALKDMVTSPGGTTIEGISALESKGFRSAAMDAVFAAYEKANRLAS